MEMLCYLGGNWCCIGAAVSLLTHKYSPQIFSKSLGLGSIGAAKKGSIGSAHDDGNIATSNSNLRESEKSRDLLISWDAMVMLFVSSLLRMYWSCSPPTVWSEEKGMTRILTALDVFTTPAVWFSVLLCIGCRQRRFHAEVPQSVRWWVLTPLAIVVGYMSVHILPPLQGHSAFIAADVAVVANMLLDGFAMVPQMMLVSATNEPAGPEVAHFVGLLSMGRVLRMIFWTVLVVGQFMHAKSQDQMHTNYVWTFVVPDFVHTLIMADYLFVWLNKVKKDSLVPLIQSTFLDV